MYRQYNVNQFELVVALTYLGRTEEAWAALREMSAQSTTAERNSDLAAARALLHAVAGQREEAHENIARSHDLGAKRDHFHHAAVVIAAACAELGDRDEAVRYLRLAADNGMPDYPLFRDNPSFRKLAGHPAYEQFMRQLELRWDRLSRQIAPPR